MKVYRSVEFREVDYALSSGQLVFSVTHNAFGILHGVYHNRILTSGNNYGIVYFGTSRGTSPAWQISVVSKHAPTLLPCIPMRLCGGDFWSSIMAKLPVAEWMAIKHSDRLHGELKSQSDADTSGSSTPARRYGLRKRNRSKPAPQFQKQSTSKKPKQSTSKKPKQPTPKKQKRSTLSKKRRSSGVESSNDDGVESEEQENANSIPC